MELHVSTIPFILLIFCSSNKCPKVAFLCHKAVLFLIFWGTSILFSIVTTPTYSPTNSAWGFPFLHIHHQNLLFSIFLKIAILKGIRWYLVALVYIRLIVIWSPFSCVCWPSACLPWKKPTRVLCLFFNWLDVSYVK